MKARGVITLAVAATATLLSASDYSPETWFHIIGGNASKEGLSADIRAIADAGIGGIQLFHGNADGKLWPGVTNPIPCLSEKWFDLVKFAEAECHRNGLRFKMQNCPGWSMSGGPWITPDKAMRKLVAFDPNARPTFDADDDYREIGSVTFPIERPEESVVRSVDLPPPSRLNHAWAYEPGAVIEVYSNGSKILERECPAGCWHDTWAGPGLEMTLDIGRAPREGLEVRVRSKHDVAGFTPVYSSERKLDNWQAKAGRSLRAFTMSTNASPIRANDKKTLVFGHVNAKRQNHPAPPEATGWECDKMSPDGFSANFAGYLGKLVELGVRIDGTLVDSWECGSQSWTMAMEEEFLRRAGYSIRPWLPALFGYVLESEAATERFLLDWRNVCSRLVEENYYGTIARLAHERGMSVQYESSFGDVITGDLLRFWKYADEPMCEFWSPHDNNGFVGSYDFKPILPCASSAHIYGKRRVSAEALTNFDPTFDENFTGWKKIVDKHFGRGVTHIVFHTYTHNPVVGGKPPSTSFGGRIGSPFLREQTWWPYLKHFVRYLEVCGRELERGYPAIDILMYLGDDVNHKPSEHELLFGNRYKYDYCNPEALTTMLTVKDGRLALPHGMNYRVLWIPNGTFLLPSTEAKLAELASKGARIIRGDFTPDWPSPLSRIGVDGKSVSWYQRRDGDTDIFFIARDDGSSRFVYVRDGEVAFFDPVTESAAELPRDATSEAINPVPQMKYPDYATERRYSAKFRFNSGEGVVLDLGRVRDWARVFVNGRKVRELWCDPFRVDISDALTPGENEIVVEITSTWYNRLVHDASLPEEKRGTWTLCGPRADSPMHPSGLLGPARILRYVRGISVASVASDDELELSIANEVEHAILRGEKAIANDESGASELKFPTNGLTRTELALKFVSSQRGDGHWIEGTNDVTRAVIDLLKKL